MSRNAEQLRSENVFTPAELSAGLRILQAERSLHASAGDAEEVRERDDQIETVERVAAGGASAADRARAREILDALKARRARALS